MHAPLHAEPRLRTMRSAVRGTALRSRLLLAVVLVTGVGLTVLTGVFNVLLADRLSGEVDRILHLRAAAQLATVAPENGHLTIDESPDDRALDSQVWVFDRMQAIEHPSAVPESVNRVVRAMARGGQRTATVQSPGTRLLAAPVKHRGRRLGTVVVAASLAPYEHTERVALVASLGLAAALLVTMTLIARWLIGAALRTVTRMTADAARWSEHELDRRFNLGPATDDLTHLAATLDGLLDRVAAGLRHERRFSSELSHELRTPLAKISAQAQLLAASSELPDGVRAEAGRIVAAAVEMRRVLDALMTAARAEFELDRGTADTVVAVRAVIDARREFAAQRGVALRFAGGPADQRAAAEPELVERMLTPLVENACRFAHGEVTLEVRRDDGWLQILVCDDGPGVAADETRSIFEPGQRGSAAADEHDGAGLGLSLARRLAHSAGGEITAETADGGRFVARLPAA